MPKSLNLKPPKLAFFDLDGTLVDANGIISTRTIQAIGWLRSQGTKICLATGRPFFGAKKIVTDLQIVDICMFFSGALLINPATTEILREEFVPYDVASTLLSNAKKLGLFSEWYTRDNYFTEEDSPNRQLHAHYLGTEPILRSFSSVSAEEKILKLELFAKTVSEEQAARDLITDYPYLTVGVGVGAAHPDLKFLNITSVNAVRDRAFDDFLKFYSISAQDVFAIGDAEADMPFISRAGYGIAMGNAPQRVKDSAFYVTSSVSDDGAAIAIEHLFSNTND